MDLNPASNRLSERIMAHNSQNGSESRIAPVVQHLSDQIVAVRSVSDAVVIAVQTLPENRQHQNAPKKHARTASVPASVGIDMGIEQCEHLSPQLLVHIQVLRTAQHLLKATLRGCRRLTLYIDATSIEPRKCEAKLTCRKHLYNNFSPQAEWIDGHPAAV